MKKQVLRRAIARLGADKQINMAIEECAELIQALNKARRCGLLDKSGDEEYSPNQMDTLLNLYGEIADVKIMLEQLVMIFDNIPGVVEQMVEEKVQRLADRYDL